VTGRAWETCAPPGRPGTDSFNAVGDLAPAAWSIAREGESRESTPFLLLGHKWSKRRVEGETTLQCQRCGRIANAGDVQSAGLQSVELSATHVGRRQLSNHGGKEVLV
jgi:hypothetical protein